METFKGTGAECLTRFINGNCKGEIRDEDGSTVMNENEWMNRHKRAWKLDWLVMPHEYAPPDPVWRVVHQVEAYTACYDGKHVQAQHASEPEEWYDISLYDGLWKTKMMYRFRVQEE